MKPYILAEHVFCALHDEQGVVFDINRDQYTSFDAAQLAAAAQFVEGWPVFTSDKRAPASAEQALRQLHQRAWVVDAHTAGAQNLTRRQFIAPARDLGLLHPVPVGIGPMATYVGAALRAKFIKRAAPVRKIIARLEARKRAHPEAALTKVLVERFITARAYLFSTKNECYYDSIALLEFLARRSIYPDWVFAVRGRPFAAHCWVQQGDLVLNDTLARVKTFTPILKI